jgi:hypothetical protein
MEGDLFLFHDGSLSSANSYSPRHLRGIPMSRLTRQERAGVTLDPQGKILIPTLNDALSVVANSGTALQVDFKGESDELAFAALELISKRKLLAQVVFQIRSAERADAIKRRYPHARILVRCLNYEQLEQALRVGVEFVELERWVSSEAIASAHARGVKVLANIASSRLDESTTWHYLRSRGIDVIMSDRAREHECRRRSS